jgi:protein O-GlcNAc transferase
MGYLIPRLLQEHNQQKYFITVYSYGLDQESDTSKKIRIHAHLYRDLKDLTDRQSAEKIHQDQIDILVDLNGHLKGSRLGICALRPVPIQVRYLGMAGTTGAPFFDYIITDRIVTPPEQSKFYSEAFAYMPHTYQVNDYVLQGQVNSLTRKKCHLSDQAFVFACFCSLYKIDPPIFDAWMQILKAVPESVLWLLQGNQQAVLNLRQEAQKRDVDPSRLVFAEHLEKTTHLQRIELADLALDTRIVNGAATTSDALWAGLPVVTIQGTHFASRMSSSLLTAIDLTELITHSLDDYVNLAVGLARNREHLEKIRKRLKVNKFTKPLFNAPLFTVNLENLYRWMWEKRFTVHG